MPGPLLQLNKFISVQNYFLHFIKFYTS